MKSLFVPSCGLNSLIDLWLTTALADTNWLFVNLDSAFGEHLLLSQKLLTPQIQGENIEFWWEDEGLWFPGKELRKDFLMDKVIVNFSAAFIFKWTVRRCSSPQFHETTDQGAFTEVQLNAAGEEISRLNAEGYVADGCGLQCVLSNENLFNLIQNGSLQR